MRLTCTACSTQRRERQMSTRICMHSASRPIALSLSIVIAAPLTMAACSSSVCLTMAGSPRLIRMCRQGGSGSEASDAGCVDILGREERTGVAV